MLRDDGNGNADYVVPPMGEVVLSRKELQKGVSKLARQIRRDYIDTGKPLVLLCILNGATAFLDELTVVLRRLNIQYAVEYIELRSYDQDGSTGEVIVGGGDKTLSALRLRLKGKHVLVIEDIIDTSRTIKFAVKLVREMNPASLRVCAMFIKRKRSNWLWRLPHFLGAIFGIPHVYAIKVIDDLFVVGSGLDFGVEAEGVGKTRFYPGLPDVCVITTAAIRYAQNQAYAQSQKAKRKEKV